MWIIPWIIHVIHNVIEGEVYYTFTTQIAIVQECHGMHSHHWNRTITWRMSLKKQYNVLSMHSFEFDAIWIVFAITFVQIMITFFKDSNQTHVQRCVWGINESKPLSLSWYENTCWISSDKNMIMIKLNKTVMWIIPWIIHVIHNVIEGEVYYTFTTQIAIVQECHGMHSHHWNRTITWRMSLKKQYNVLSMHSFEFDAIWIVFAITFVQIILKIQTKHTSKDAFEESIETFVAFAVRKHLLDFFRQEAGLLSIHTDKTD